VTNADRGGIADAGTTTVRRPRRPLVGAEIRRWRAQRGLTLAQVADRSGLNIGYLSQIENDKASPSLESLAAIGDALDVPVAWFLLGDASAPVVVRAAERSVKVGPDGGRMERIDAGTSRDLAILQVCVPPGTGIGDHTHPGLEHHLVVTGSWRMRQGPHEFVLGPGDYVRWDGTVPHAAECIGTEEGAMLIVSVRRPGADPVEPTGSAVPTRSVTVPSSASEA
jgi:transcriptional regulator with XRE-family HTH domain